jgi:hypothetical protein
MVEVISQTLRLWRHHSMGNLPCALTTTPQSIK